MKVRFVFAQVRIKLSCFFLCILYMYNHLSGEDVFSLWYRRLAKHSSSPRIGFEFMRFWLLVQMLYHWATKDSWELRRLNQVHVTNILYTALRTIGLVSHSASEVTQSGWFCVHWLRPYYDRPLCFLFEVRQSRSLSHSHSRLEQIARFSRLTRLSNFERASEHPEATTTRVKNFWAHFGANRSQVLLQFLEWTIIIKRLVPKAVFFVAKEGEAQKCFLFLGSQ